MKLTVDITISIMTDIGSSIMPKSKCRLPRGSQVKLYGTSVANAPSAHLSAVK